MNIFHKGLIILNLLLALGALLFVFFLHEQREILKSQIGEHRDHVVRMAEKLEWGALELREAEVSTKGHTHLLGSWSNEPRNHPQRMKNTLTDYTQMRVGLVAMEKVLEDRIRALVDAKLAYDKLDVKLEGTEETLTATENTLAATQKQLAEEQTALTTAQREIANQEEQLRKTAAELRERDTEIVSLNEDIFKQNAKFASLKDTYIDTKTELIACLTRRTGPKDPTQTQPVGEVASVESDWDFVVINMGRKDQVFQGNVGMVYRGDQLIGRVKISKVNDKVAIGKLQKEFSLAGVQIKPSDRVMF